jgi:hypothetical protein
VLGAPTIADFRSLALAASGHPLERWGRCPRIRCPMTAVYSHPPYATRGDRTREGIEHGVSGEGEEGEG